MNGALIKIRRLMANQRTNTFFLVVIWVGTITASILLSSTPFQSIHDDFKNGYYIGALNLHEHGSYTDSEGNLITHWPPGYSLYIAPFVTDDIEETFGRLKWLSAATLAIWILVVYLLIRKLLHHIPPYIPLGLCVLWPPIIALGNPGYCALLLALLVSIAFLLLDSVVKLNKMTVKSLLLSIVVGVLFGMAGLTKTIALPVTAISLVVVLLGMHNVRWFTRIVHVLLMATAFLLTLLPWITTYKLHTGHYGFTSARGSSVWDGLSRFPDLTVVQCLSKHRLTSFSGSDASDTTAGWMKCFINHPLSTLRLFSIKAVRVWYGTNSGRHEKLLAALNIPWLLLFIMSTCGILWSIRETPVTIILLLSCVLVVWASSIVVLSIFRYLTPFFPFVLIVVLSFFPRALRMFKSYRSLTAKGT